MHGRAEFVAAVTTRSSSEPTSSIVLDVLKHPTWLLIQTDQEDDGVYLLHYAGAEWAGDTWHVSIDEAMEQAIAFGVGKESWIPVPAEISDIETSLPALRELAQR